MIILDSAMGTELDRRGADTTLPLWSARAIVTSPQLITQIHRDNIAAGARVITANTFRTNPRTLRRARVALSARELTFTAVALARDAIQSFTRHNVQIAGSLAPVEDCYSPWLVPSDAELAREHAEHARNLADAGCDMILIETMNTIREAVAAARAAQSTGLPMWVSFTLDDGNNLFSGETLDAAVGALQPFKPDAILVNCIPVAQVASALRVLAQSVGASTTIGAYANVGHVDDNVGWTLTDSVSPAAYARAARHWRSLGATVIGGCCGTTPDHIAAVNRSEIA